MLFNVHPPKLEMQEERPRSIYYLPQESNKNYEIIYKSAILCSTEVRRAVSFSSGGLLKWFRNLRSNYWGVRQEMAAEQPMITRSHPLYRSNEHKQQKEKQQHQRRRHSFSDRQVTPPPRRSRSRSNGSDSKSRRQQQQQQQQRKASRVPQALRMMPSRSTPNLQQQPIHRDNKNNHVHQQQHHQQHQQQQQNQTIYSYIQNPNSTSFKKSLPPPVRDEDSPPPAPPVRDSSTLKSIKYGPGHEKYPSWPVPAAAETPPALRAHPPGGGSHRSKSWTDHTNYPKEKVVAYTRPYMKRQHSLYTQQKLKTVMERCEKIPPETYESKYDKLQDRLYIDRDGKSATLKDMEYMVPSPPERDIPNGKPQLTQADLEEYARSYQEPKYPSHHLTKSGLEEFMEFTAHANYEDSLFSSMGSKHELSHLHQKQLSYAQSEGYHSYVSSTDSTSTPFLDRLRRDSEAARGSWEDQEQHHEPQSRREGRDSVVTTSSGSVSSSETLKWHGSMSDVSVASSSCTHLASSSISNASTVSKQLIVHSARVQTPQRHHSESVLYMGAEGQKADVWKDKENRNNNANKLKLFPVNTYTVQENNERHGGGGSNVNTSSNRLSLSLSTSLSVADRISELEKQQKYSYLDPDKRHKVPDPTLKAIQKKALLSFYERHQNSSRNSWRSEPQLAQAQQLSTSMTIPQPPPRVKVQLPSRRASSASDYASGNTSKRSSLSCTREAKTTESIVAKTVPKHQYSNSCGSLATEFLGPMIVGQAISLDDFVPDKPPARPPKNPHLRAAFPDLFVDQRIPSPDLPPPSPPTVLEDEVLQSDEPLPPPPPDCDSWQHERLKNNDTKSAMKQTVGLPEQGLCGVRSSIKTRPGGHIIQQVSSKPYGKPEQILGFPNQQTYAERSNTKYPTAQKLVLGGTVAVSQKVVNGLSDPYRAEPLKPLKDEKKCKDQPPPLQPRQSHNNHSMRGRVATSRNSPPKEKYQQPLSQSKASYLASRRDRDRIVPDSDTGSYKRTMSPNGHSLASEVIPEPQKPLTQKDSIWSLTRSSKELVKNNNNTNLIRRSSMNNEKKKAATLHEKKCEDKEELKKATMVLPDVLPMNAKMLSTRSQQYRPTNLNLSPVENGLKKSPPLSPTKTPPPRGSPFTPLRSTNLSNPPTNPSYLRPVPKSASPVRTFTSSSTNVSPPSPKRISPQIKQALSPSQTVRKATPSSSNTSSPLQSSPNCSPKSSPPPSPKECPPVVEGLQLIQRTEVVLRVNTTTTDAASQTEKEELPPTPLPSRKKLQEEIECEKLSEDFVELLPTSDRLKELLVPGPEHKKPTDYVQGLFKVEVTSRPRPANSPFRSRNNTPSSSPPPTIATTLTNTPSPKISSVNTSISDSTSPLSGSSTYFTISESRARFLNRFSQDMNQCHDVKDTKDLNLKKAELVNRLDKKLHVLRSEQVVVSEECKINNELGENVEAHIRRLARPHEADKFRLHVEEVGKITSLLLGLSGRLARAENALMGMEDDHPERRILESKRDKLLEQLEEAKKLKECIDRRSVNVSNILYKYLNSEEYTDYDHFINMKAKLIMDSKEIADKIKLGEEQLSALKATLIVTD